MTLSGFLVLFVLLAGRWSGIEGHGYLFDPPSRSSLWRHDVAGAPKNYDDNALNCGGAWREYGSGKKRCGVCGDPFDQPQPRNNEAGGKYGKGIIFRTYEVGQTVNIRVTITANHQGFFEFKLCPNNDVKKIVTQDCLDRHVLEQADGSGTHWPLPGNVIGTVTVPVKLPQGLVCSQCVLQWRWKDGNSEGVDPDGRRCMGCGDQEEFYGCADIAIVPSGQALALTEPTPDVRHQEPPAQFPTVPFWQLANMPTPTQAPWIPVSTPRWMLVKESPVQQPTNPPRPANPWGERLTNPPATSGPGDIPLMQDPTFSPTRTPVKCFAVNNLAGVPRFDLWCEQSCALGRCLSFFCSCT